MTILHVTSSFNFKRSNVFADRKRQGGNQSWNSTDKRSVYRVEADTL